jgi:hypothetical protein
MILRKNKCFLCSTFVNKMDSHLIKTKVYLGTGDLAGVTRAHRRKEVPGEDT